MDVLNEGTLSTHGSSATLANLMSDLSSHDNALKQAEVLQSVRMHECHNPFDDKNPPVYPHFEDGHQRIRRKMFAHGPVDRETAEVQYPSIGTIEQTLSGTLSSR